MKGARLLSLPICIWALGFSVATAQNGTNGTTATKQILDFNRDYLITRDKAVALLAPRVVCGATVTDLAWSTDGQWLVAAQLDAATIEARSLSPLQGQSAATGPVPISLVFYNAKSGKVRTPLALPPNVTRLEPLQWIANSSTAIVQTTQENPTPGEDPLLQIQIVSTDGHAKTVASSNYEVRAVPAPTRPLVAIFETQRLPKGTLPGGAVFAQKLRVIDANGDVLASTDVRSEYSHNPYWTEKGELYFAYNQMVAGKKPMTISTFMHFNLATGKLEDVPSQGSEFVRTEYDMPYLIVPLRTTLPTVNSDRVQGLALGSPTIKGGPSEYAVVSSDGTFGAVSPKGQAVAYISRGVALIRPLVEVPHDALIKAKVTAQRAELLDQVKQVGAAALIMSADYDGQLMAPTGDWKDRLKPYIKDPSMMNNFVYSFGGGLLANQNSPATTELGFTPGPGGRAVVYLDGHAVWISNP